MKVQKVEYGPDDGMNPQGSSLMGYVTATFDSLVELLGEPNCPPGDKVWNSWDLCFTVYDKDGEDFENVYASIYDWKEMHPFASTSGEYRWHIDIGLLYFFGSDNSFKSFFIFLPPSLQI